MAGIMSRKIKTPLFMVLFASTLAFILYIPLLKSSFLGQNEPGNLIVIRGTGEQSLVFEFQGQEELGRKAPETALLLPEWEVLVLFTLETSTENNLPRDSGLSCMFQDGLWTPARPAGKLFPGYRIAVRCSVPAKLRRIRPFKQPKLVLSGEFPDDLSGQDSPELARWNFVVYDTLTTKEDVMLFAKGINSRQGVNFPARELACVFSGGVRTRVLSSSQEVFRCQKPRRDISPQISGEIVTLDIGGRIIPSVAIYQPLSPQTSLPTKQFTGKPLLCACTMVFNAGKFLKEWVMYHSFIGVEHFYFYDNLSDDNTHNVLMELENQGYGITRRVWPWPKTQEAGFSHCAQSTMDSCEWMLFTDVDEFVFSPKWGNLQDPRNALQPLLKQTQDNSSRIGQISINCLDFGPSNQTTHPLKGLMQGYDCRGRRIQRHKSVVQLKAIAPSLFTKVHHFELKPGFKSKKLGLSEFVVNHYKYQAWSEFKTKFRRRVSTYVVDWTTNKNLRSKDRTPGLDNSAIEPEGWAQSFCEVRDRRLQILSKRWFGEESKTGYSMAWEE
ncbi:glycosyltransferase family 92 protein Os08g0121900 [Amborella trichopoda]|uniref:Glycosyltransferase family 92 protein n=1 Tax=Amborella trichopoda TaxID=13333 RepID=U5D9Z7_AMBTC|nr:glycosyltransferase family 92 protein Os08g0121900 [Amborella trichopoda]ERN17213.1 hypothetical protein AMTR_s00044p00166030 [Amborella trichopoda]|eukprot:XP_006855746.3 glycosyltransferase family 92 protein Os08g0121900 [Amborella trichopoda]